MKPPLGATVMVELVDSPCITGAGELALKEKLGMGAAAVTVNATVVVSTVLPAVPVTVAV